MGDTYSGMNVALMTPIAHDRTTQHRFPTALKGLMEERHLSYRQLAYKTQLSAGYLNHLTKGTRPVPSDPVMAVIARALCVDPDYFLESRLRQVARVLARSPELTDRLFGVLLREDPVSDEILDLLAEAPTGNGYGRHADDDDEEY
jgi:transcriptional regulator with XRE-family HTH domain